MASKRHRALADRICAKLLRERDDVVAVLLTGSVGRGDAQRHSDIDLHAIAHRGGPSTRFVLNGIHVSVDVSTPDAWRRSMVEPDTWLPLRHGGLAGEVLHDPMAVVESVREEVRRLPWRVYREAAAMALTGMYEDLGKVRNARTARDRGLLIWGAFAVAVGAAMTVALLNRRAYASENTVATEWRTFAALPRTFAQNFEAAFGLRSVRDARRHDATVTLWDIVRRFAGRRGVALHTAPRLAAVRFRPRKTT
jgi:predicted nucleotidyltransferase